METETLYKKVGRKYVPVQALWYEDRVTDRMKVGTFRLSYAYSNGGTRYEYDVTPATAPTVAAMMIARVAMEECIKEKSTMYPVTSLKYTKKQLEVIEKFKKDMDSMHPIWWTERSSYEISQAAMNAVKDFTP